jgi:hypothetical protein
MHHPFDQFFKGVMGWCIAPESEVELERAVHVPVQRIDLAYSARSSVPVPDLGLVGEMLALGPGMMEYFARGPSPGDVKACVRKRLAYEHERARDAERRRLPAPAEPWLWILCPRQPREALQAYAAAPMTGWPPGVWQSWREPRMRFVVLSALPETPETLLLRIFGRGATMARAIAQIDALPAGHLLRGRLEPALLAFEPLLMQISRSDMHPLLEQIRQNYEAWERRALQKGEALGRKEGREEGRKEGRKKGREEALRDVLIGLLTQRFGGVPPERALARIHAADADTLARWTSRVLTAASLDDVLA